MEQTKEQNKGTEEIDFRELQRITGNIPTINKLIFFSIILYLVIFIGGYYVGYGISYNKAKEYQLDNCKCIEKADMELYNPQPIKELKNGNMGSDYLAFALGY